MGELEDMRQSIQGYYGYAQNIQKYRLYLKEELKAGNISRSQYAQLQAEARSIGESRQQEAQRKYIEGDTPQFKTKEVPVKYSSPQRSDTTQVESVRAPTAQTTNSADLTKSQTGNVAARQELARQAQAEPQLRSVDVYKSGVRVDGGPYMTFEQYRSSKEDQMIQQNRLIKAAYPEETRGLPENQGYIMLEERQQEQPKDPNLIQRSWAAINKPVDVSKVPILGSARRGLNVFMAFNLAREKQAGERQAQSTNPLISAWGRARSGTASLNVDFYKTLEADIRRPSTWALAGIGSGIVRGAKAAGSLPAIQKISTPAAQKILKGGLLTLYGGTQAREIYQGRKSVGDVLGETAAYGLAYSVVDPAIGKVQSTAQKAAGAFKQWQYDKALQRWERSLSSGEPFRLSEGAQGPQRTLTGGSISDKQLRQTIQQLNKNKLGFGIERNPLRPYRENILGSGQTKLSRDQIIAFDSLGNMRNVRVVNQQPFVYDPKLQRYIEFNPDKYFLRTVKTSPMGDPDQVSRSLQAMRSYFAIKPSVQTKLVAPQAPSRSMSIPIVGPTAPKSTGSLPSIISQGAEAIGINRAALTNYMQPPAQTIPNYIYPVEQALPSIPLADNKGVELFLARVGLSSPTKLSPKISASVRPTQSPFEIQEPTPGQSPRESGLTAQRFEALPNVIKAQLPKISPIYEQTPRTEQLPKVTPILDQLPITAPAPSAPVPPSPTPWPAINIFQEIPQPNKPEIPGLPIWFSSLPNKQSSIFKIPEQRIQPRGFLPTLKSNVLAEFGKTPRFNIISGLGERYIPEKSKKKRRRKS